MMFKKPKEAVVQDAMSAAYNAANLNINNMAGQAPNQWSYSIQTAIQMAIGDAIKSLIDNMYTDAEFEEDMGLREKNNDIKR